MPLTSGTRVGPYEIKSLIGAGGMGEVHRARDTRLDRTVAIKVLPESFSSDPGRLDRFRHEARILSTLNHPNIVAIYDVGEQDGLRYLVSEFLEGQSLREVLALGAVPRRKLVEYALDICKGLAAAHDKGVIHRDLKPDNIFVTQDDRVKVLDFGLAKQSLAEPEMPGATVTAPAPTTPGTVMGTVGYMSPEQVRGQTIDYRSDIFSFGAILYEMASGKRAFHGDSSVETMNAILKDDVPELSTSNTQVSPGLDRIIRRCLEKKPERRFQSAADLAFALEALSATSSISQALPEPAPVSGKRSLLWMAAAIVPLALLATAAWLWLRPGSYNLNFQQISFRPSYIRTARFAPGRTVVYAASINGAPMTLFSARTDTFESQPLNLKADLLSVSRSSELAVSIDRDFSNMWTPTGRLAEAPLGGGSTRELLDQVIDADWNKDGTELAVARQVGRQIRLEYPIGKVLYQTPGYISDVRFAPSGDQIAFLDHAIVGDDRGAVCIIDPEGHRRVLTPEFESAQGLAWTPNGKEIWFAASDSAEPNSIRAVDLQGHTRTVLAAPVRLHLQDVGEDGQLLLSTEAVHWQIGIGNSKSGQTEDLSPFEYESLGSVSNDGGNIALNSFDIAGDTSYRLYLQRSDGSSPVLVGHGVGSAFSNDGKWLAAVDPAHPDNLFIVPIGIGEARTVHAPAGRHYDGAAFFPDGKRLLITTVATGQNPQSAIQDIETGSVQAIGPAGRFVSAENGKLFPGPSPDGKYCIQIDGQGNYWLQSLPSGEARPIHGIAADEHILNWHSDSNNIFLARDDGPNVQVSNLHLLSGRRDAWTSFSPLDKTSQISNTELLITPDGAHFAYEAHKIYSTLFVANRMR